MARSKDLTPDRSARHLFGAKMRERREGKGWSLEALSGKVQVSRSQLARIETAEQMIPPELPPKLDTLFEAGKEFRDLFGVARNEIHPDRFKRLMELEGRAVVIKEYSPQIVPGMLQTEAYARVLFTIGNPMAKPEEIEKLVAARLDRQARLLREGGPEYAVILDEAVLRRPCGSPAVMREQLKYLLECALKRPSISIQVIPFSHGNHSLVGGLLSLCTLEGGQQVAYEESITTGTLLEDKEVVMERVRRYDRLSAAALPPKMSIDFLRSVMEAIPDEHHP
ncbi:helix-turn-helix transcriptional regulator [Streptomyces sp. NPDC000594]|uniref:helix-turn-helix domain-containing protein n=1 Tax=Streptomyces sp. NPDC000594 TaxID=3154261 RepID=UPI00331B4268